LTASLADGVLVVRAPKKEIEEERDVKHIPITEEPHLEKMSRRMESHLSLKENSERPFLPLNFSYS